MSTYTSQQTEIAIPEQRHTKAAVTEQHDAKKQAQAKSKFKPRGSRAGASFQRTKAQDTPVHLQRVQTDSKTTCYATTPIAELDRILQEQTGFIEREFTTSRIGNLIVTDDWSQQSIILAAFSVYEKAQSRRSNLVKLFDVIEFVAYVCEVQNLRLAGQAELLGIWPSVPDGLSQSPERYLLNASLPMELVPFVEALRPWTTAEGDLVVYAPYIYNDPVTHHVIDTSHPFHEVNHPQLRGPQVFKDGQLRDIPLHFQKFRPSVLSLMRLRDAAIAQHRHSLSAREINECLGFEATPFTWRLNPYGDDLTAAGRVLGSTPFGYVFRINSLIPLAFSDFSLATNFFRHLWTTMKDGPTPVVHTGEGAILCSKKRSITQSITSPIVLLNTVRFSAYNAFWQTVGLDPIPSVNKSARLELAEVGAAFAHTGDTGPSLREFIHAHADLAWRL